MRFLKLPIPQHPTGLQDQRVFGPVIAAIQALARGLDSVLGGAPLAPSRATSYPDSLQAPALVYYSETGVVTADPSEGYNAVYLGGGKIVSGPAIVRGFSGLVVGRQYFLELDTGAITNTPNSNSRLQLLGTAISPSDLFFQYSPPNAN